MKSAAAAVRAVAGHFSREGGLGFLWAAVGGGESPSLAVLRPSSLQRWAYWPAFSPAQKDVGAYAHPNELNISPFFGGKLNQSFLTFVNRPLVPLVLTTDLIQQEQSGFAILLFFLGKTMITEF